MNTIFKVGDTVYDSVNFPNETGKIIEIKWVDEYPLFVEFEHGTRYRYYTSEGKCLSSDYFSTLSFTPYVLTLKGFSQERPIEYPETTIDDLNTYEKCCKYLKRYNKLPVYYDNQHNKAFTAMWKLITIAEAWNKVDEFVPDFSNRNQNKWFPWFIYKAAGFAYSTTNYAAANMAANFGSRLCFKTSERARQFGEQFIDLWNDFLLIK